MTRNVAWILLALAFMFIILMLAGCYRSQPPGKNLGEILRQHEERQHAP